MSLFKRHLPRFTLLSAFFAVMGGGLVSPAQAAMTFCNKTQGSIEAALGRREGDVWASEGWWMLEPGKCLKVLGGPLTERFYFYFATALVRPAKDQDPFTWSGKYQFCTSNQPFRVDGDSDCENKGYITRGFQQIDVGAHTHDYTLDFKEGGK